MRKILGGASALALVMALSAPAQAADLTVDGVGSISDANAISVNLQSQDVHQSIDNEENVDGTYNGDMNFGDFTYEDQHINSNNVNSGMNGAQQNGVSFSIDLEGSGYELEIDGLETGDLELDWDDETLEFDDSSVDHAHIKPGTAAVSANALKQVATQSIDSSDENVDDDSVYNGDMNFGQDTFRNQAINANNFNSGMNAAQQGGVAVSVNMPKFYGID